VVNQTLKTLKRWDTITLHLTNNTTTTGWYWTHQPNLAHDPGSTLCLIPHKTPHLYTFHPTTTITKITDHHPHTPNTPDPLNW